MARLNLDDNAELAEFMEQLNYALSLGFKEKWRHRFSEHFISLFQEKILISLQTQKPIKLSSVISMFVKKHKYNTDLVSDFLECIDISLYYPLIYRDRSKAK